MPIRRAVLGAPASSTGRVGRPLRAAARAGADVRWSRGPRIAAQLLPRSASSPAPFRCGVSAVGSPNSVKSAACVCRFWGVWASPTEYSSGSWVAAMLSIESHGRCSLVAAGCGETAEPRVFAGCMCVAIRNSHCQRVAIMPGIAHPWSVVHPASSCLRCCIMARFVAHIVTRGLASRGGGRSASGIDPLWQCALVTAGLRHGICFGCSPADPSPILAPRRTTG